MRIADSFEKTLMLGKIEGGRIRGQQRRMASLIQWTWVWVNSRSWWWTGRPGMLWFMGSQRVKHDWATELNWAELNLYLSPIHSLSTVPYPFLGKHKCFFCIYEVGSFSVCFVLLYFVLFSLTYFTSIMPSRFIDLVDKWQEFLSMPKLYMCVCVCVYIHVTSLPIHLSMDAYVVSVSELL